MSKLQQIYEQVCYSDLVDEEVFSDYESSDSDSDDECYEMKQVADYNNVKVLDIGSVFSEVEAQFVKQQVDRLPLVDEMQPLADSVVVPVPNSTDVSFVSNGDQLYVVDGQELIVVGKYRSFPKAVYRTYVTLTFGVVDVRCYAVQRFDMLMDSYDQELSMIQKVQSDYEAEVADHSLVSHYAFNLRNFFLTVDGRARRKFKFFAASVYAPYHIPSLTERGNVALIVVDKETCSKFFYPVRVTARLEVCVDGNLYAWHRQVIRTRCEVPRGVEMGVYTFMLTQKVIYGVAMKVWTPYCLTSFGEADTISYVRMLEQRFDAPITRARLMQLLIPVQQESFNQESGSGDAQDPGSVTSMESCDTEEKGEQKNNTVSSQQECGEDQRQTNQKKVKIIVHADGNKGKNKTSEDHREDPKLDTNRGRAPKKKRKEQKKQNARRKD